jgi:Pectinacetylesterase
MKSPFFAAILLGVVACGSSGSSPSPSSATPASAQVEAGAPPAAPPGAGSPSPRPSSDGGSGGGDVDAGAPIVAPNETWTWVDVPGAVCADGSPTGIGVNLTNRSDDVVLFLEGGGACWDGTSCWGTTQTAFYITTGYGKAEFATDPQISAMYVLNRADADNPFADKNIVYVPYCTGDSFAGDNVEILGYLGTDHATHFVGYRNLGLYLQRMLATFPRAKRVWLMGDSAGGFGAAFNFGRVQDAFALARVDVLDDSGQPIAPDPAQWEKWKSAWNMQLPSGCTACEAGPGGFVDYYRNKYPTSRFGLVSYDHDVVIAPFMNITLDVFHTELYALADHVDATWPGGRYFILSGSSHVGLLSPTPALKDWVKRMATDSPSWGSTRP